MKKNTTAKKSSKVLSKGKQTHIRQVSANQLLTVGLDLGDRTSRYCVLGEAGEVVSEDQVRPPGRGWIRYWEECHRAEYRWKWERIRHG